MISEGVFGMRGEQGKLKEIAALKSKYKFRFLVDDAHGFGTLGENGKGAGNEQGVQDQIDVYFATFAKSMALPASYPMLVIQSLKLEDLQISTLLPRVTVTFLVLATT